MRKGGWLGLALALGVGVLGCGELGDRSRFDPVVGSLEIVATVPTQGDEGFDPVGRIDVCFSDVLDPRSVQAFDGLVNSGRLTFDGEIEVQLFSWRAAGRRDALADSRWCQGSVVSVTPGGSLQPGLGYRVELRPSPRGWAGERIDLEQDGWIIDPSQEDEDEPSYFIEFRTAGSPADPPLEEIPELPPGPALEQLFEPGRVFDPERAACGCHQRTGELAMELLDLSTPERAWNGLVLRQGPESTGFPMVSPRRPSESYLIQKLLRDSQGQALRHVQGGPMPPEGELEHGDLTDLAHWIHSL